MQDAACVGIPTSEFFPDDANDDTTHVRHEVCGTCPVVTHCLDYAHAHDLYGIWGGTTRYQRRKVAS